MSSLRNSGSMSGADARRREEMKKLQKAKEKERQRMHEAKERRRRELKEQEKARMKQEAERMLQQSNVLKKRQSEFQYPTVFSNDLPDVPFDAKLMRITVDRERLIKYDDAELAQHKEQPLCPEVDLGSPLLLVDPYVYAHSSSSDASARMHSEDAALFDISGGSDAATTGAGLGGSDGVARGLSSSGSTRGGAGRKGGLLGPQAVRLDAERRQQLKLSVPWLRKTEWMDPNRVLPRFKSAHETKQARSAPLTARLDRNSQIEAILASFDAAQRKPRHPEKKNVTAVDVMYVLPDEVVYPNDYAEVRFDADPFEAEAKKARGDGDGDGGGNGDAKPVTDEKEANELAPNGRALSVLRPDITDEGERFTDYYAPPLSVLRKRRRLASEGIDPMLAEYSDDDEIGADHLVYQRSYHTREVGEKGMVAGEPGSARQVYAFAIVDEAAARKSGREQAGVFYVPVTERLELRPVTHKSRGMKRATRSRHLFVQRRPLTEEEDNQRKLKLVRLGYEAVMVENEAAGGATATSATEGGSTFNERGSRNPWDDDNVDVYGENE